MRNTNCVVDVDYAQFYKKKQRIGGDVFLSSRDPEKTRIGCTLSDGLGSGIKANVLANITANMAQKLSFSPLQVIKSSEIIMDTLPVCKERKISYATFSIVQMQLDSTEEIKTRIIEYDNPNSFLFDGNTPVDFKPQKIALKRKRGGKSELVRYNELVLRDGHRLVLMTDGVTQSGIGTKAYPLGWREKPLREFIRESIAKNSQISSKELAKLIIMRARANDGGEPGDDITCAVITVRKPRDLVLASGPPFHKEHDKNLVDQVMQFTGKKIVSGGTTAQIFSRELNKRIFVDLKNRDREVPPCSRIEGIDLVTEGMLTLNRAAIELENRNPVENITSSSVRSFVELILQSDRILFLVGTKINEAHQDPNIPVEIGIRRSTIHRIRQILETTYMKETEVRYL
ncbi:MAG: serine/threonine protein phosphatase [Spirochaetia bacterium]|nr:serine/threonine protein phosphatase [Spirochaetia bacterium]